MCECLCVFVCMSVCVCVCVYECMCVCVYECECVCVGVSSETGEGSGKHGEVMSQLWL